MVELLKTSDKKILYPLYEKWISLKPYMIKVSRDIFFDVIEQGVVWINKQHEKISGILIVHIDKNILYITYLFGDTQSSKIELLKALEVYAKQFHFKSTKIHFLNPIKKAWHLFSNVTHPNLPGEAIHEEDVLVYQMCGFQINSQEDVYYRHLVDFKYVMSESLDEPYKICLYQKHLHKGLDLCMAALNQKDWMNHVLNNEAQDVPHPICVALYEDQVVGFAGPMFLEPTQRGYFAGIGVLSTHRGHKLGKHLFFNLCQHLKEMNASYMTLFTGSTNPAKHIYQMFGFEIFMSFYTMVKI